MLDLMFSCRVQSKRVEHAFIAFVMRGFVERGVDMFKVRYRPTEKNKSSAGFFWNMGFRDIDNDGEFKILGYDLTLGSPSEDLVTVHAASQPL